MPDSLAKRIEGTKEEKEVHSLLESNLMFSI
jgi:hypothetical protein